MGCASSKPAMNESGDAVSTVLGRGLNDVNGMSL
jgi:hypothetical protein